MNLNRKSLALLVVLVVVTVVAGSVFAAAAVPAVPVGQATPEAASCADLPLDEMYACRYGGWQPTQPAEGSSPEVGVVCADLRLDEYYACRLAGWQPESNEHVHSR